MKGRISDIIPLSHSKMQKIRNSLSLFSVCCRGKIDNKVDQKIVQKIIRD